MPSLNPNKTGKAYWRSLDELADTPKFRAFVEKEFADYQPEQVLASPSRRSMLKLMGASMALAGAGGLSGCRRWPEQHVAPFNDRPEGFDPGDKVKYATAMELGGVAAPLVITTVDGRPIKAEGNENHPLSGGASGRYAQASVLDMFDPHRSRSVMHAGHESSWAEFEKTLANLPANGSMAVLVEPTGSPTAQRLLGELSDVKVYQYGPLSHDNALEGARMALGEPLRAQHHVDKADVVACFDADLLGNDPAHLKHAKHWARGRDVDSPGFKRLYAAESAFTITGTNADHRVPIQSSRVLDVLKAVASKLGVSVTPSTSLGQYTQHWVSLLVDDLKANKGKSLVAVGPDQPAAAHALAAMVNDALGNLGKTVTYIDVPTGYTKPGVDQIAQLVRDIDAGQIDTLVMLGGNPVYDAPIDLAFADALGKVNTSIHLSHYNNETSKACTWHLPRAHYLEAWGDATAWDGSTIIQQPMILPLFGGRTPIQLLAMLGGGEATDGEPLVRKTHSDMNERTWRKALHDGVVEGSTPAPKSVSVSRDKLSMITAVTSDDGLEVTLKEDYSVYDGRFANNGWLQETPDPITKMVWDNAALINPKTAKKLDVSQDDLIELTVGQNAMQAAVFIQPGQADDSIAVSLGYGRTAAGYVGNKVGFDAYQVRTSARMSFAPVSVKKTRRRYRLVTTQDHNAIDSLGAQEREWRASGELFREATLGQYEHYKEHPHHGDFSLEHRAHIPDMKQENGKVVPLQVFDEPVQYEGHRWAMAIDLSKCIGCNGCVVACQAENNIAVVGKYECGRGREMAWIRVDRYFKGDPDKAESIDAVHQVVTCHHCENAPCEQVCPVAATVHDSEGINAMIYNRCIGTRYCSNNCPYKVRRFNYFDWHAKPVKSAEWGATWLGMPDQQQRSIDKVRQMQFNPEVTVRMRGVMEKCTFCLQRIKAVTIPAKNEDPDYKLEDGAITPACAQSCATEAIIFGDLSDPESRVSKAFESDRAYEMLKMLNVRARTRYLARITNPADDESHEADNGHGSHDDHAAEAAHDAHGEDAH